MGDLGVEFTKDGRSSPAHAEATPMPMVNNAMAKVDAAIAKALASVVRLIIVIVPSQNVLISVSDYRECASGAPSTSSIKHVIDRKS